MSAKFASGSEAPSVSSFGLFQAPDLATLLKHNDIDASTQRHIGRVYTALAWNVLVAAGGVFAWHAFPLLRAVPLFLWALASLASVGWLLSHAWKLNGEGHRNEDSATGGVGGASLKQQGIWTLFGLLEGLCLGPFVAQLALINPSIPATAFAMTVAIFTSFTASALLSKRRSWLYLGGLLSSALSYLFWASLLNLFLGWSVLVSVDAYLGLVVFSGYVMFDTQVMVEKAAAGDRNHVIHALSLFLDFIHIFIRVAIILARHQARRGGGGGGGGGSVDSIV